MAVDLNPARLAKLVATTSAALPASTAQLKPVPKRSQNHRLRCVPGVNGLLNAQSLIEGGNPCQ
jgi:hypothetical protein